MGAYQADSDRFEGYDAQVVGMSVDSTYSHIAWQKHDIGMLNYPLGSDFWPHGEVARKYGVLREAEPLPGLNNRTVYVIDKHGKIVFAKQYELGEQPPNEEVYEALHNLQG